MLCVAQEQACKCWGIANQTSEDQETTKQSPLTRIMNTIDNDSSMLSVIVNKVLL